MNINEPTPAEIVERYTEELYHQRNLDALDGLMADPVVRHEPDGSRVTLTLEEAKVRVRSFHEQFRSMRFTNRKIVQDEDSVATAYEADLVDQDGDVVTICGIEIFTIRAGRITEVWNPPAGDGSWG